MLNQLFSSVYSTGTTQVNLTALCASLVTALLLGWVSAKVYQYKTVYTKSFVITLALLPAVVATVIALVNGNLGAGVAVAGAFSLVRFRSAPGGAKEIYAIFLAMVIGLATGMGYLGVAVCVTLILSVVALAYEHLEFGKMPQAARQLTITIPENLDYEELFDSALAELTSRYELLSVRTSDMGSLFKLKYRIQLKADVSEKQLLDMVRVRNGNLEVAISRNFTKDNEL